MVAFGSEACGDTASGSAVREVGDKSALFCGSDLSNSNYVVFANEEYQFIIIADSNRKLNI
jgi:hypothetical protein